MRIVKGSAGSFLAPPGHPSHFYSVQDGPSADPNLIAGLDYAIKNEYGDVPEPTQRQAQRLLDEAELVPSEAWIAHTYSYFHNCYATEDGSRNASNAIIPKKGDEVPPPERHLGYLMVREYFPDHEPRLDLMASTTGYGIRSCTNCGVKLQYEAKVDAWATVPRMSIVPLPQRKAYNITACPSGGTHIPKEP